MILWSVYDVLGVFNRIMWPSFMRSLICLTNIDTMFLNTCRIMTDHIHFFFQQDAIRTDTAYNSLRCFDSFCDKITKGLWPPRSPNLNLCDCDLSSVLNDKLHSNNLQNEQDVKRSIQDVLSSVAPAELLRTVNNVSVRCDSCVEAERNQSQHLL
jgi:hypothetical protein